MCVSEDVEPRAQSAQLRLYQVRASGVRQEAHRTHVEPGRHELGPRQEVREGEHGRVVRAGEGGRVHGGEHLGRGAVARCRGALPWRGAVARC